MEYLHPPLHFVLTSSDLLHNPLVQNVIYEVSLAEEDVVDTRRGVGNVEIFRHALHLLADETPDRLHAKPLRKGYEI